MVKRDWIALLITFVGHLTCAAQLIAISNPSFEGDPADATVPQGWMACKEGTTPDILPGYWGVYNESADGDTYLGLITRENNTWESIGQRLPEHLGKGRCYMMSLDLSHSDTYSGYNGPLKLRIWASKVKCQKEQLVYESPLIEHSDWRTYTFKFTAEDEFWYILLEAFHSEKEFAYKGNILIDRMSAIKGCDRS